MQYALFYMYTMYIAVQNNATREKYAESAQLEVTSLYGIDRAPFPSAVLSDHKSGSRDNDKRARSGAAKGRAIVVNHATSQGTVVRWSRS